jgi:ferredoxin
MIYLPPVGTKRLLCIFLPVFLSFFFASTNKHQGGLFMAHKITDACLACGTCIPECPSEAISEGDPIYKIDASKCTDCGTCVAACPAEAIFPA